MPFANNNGIRIHYEVEGNGIPIVFSYGCFNILQMWYDFGYVKALQDKFQLILIDIRGHGLSEKPHEIAAYELPILVGDITAVLDLEGIDKAHYYGFSLGGYIGWGITKYAPTRFHSLMIASFTPDKASDDAGVSRATQLHHFFQQGSKFCTNVFRNVFGEFWQASWDEIYAKADLKAIDALVARWEGFDRDEHLAKFQLPCLLVCAEHDQELEGMRVLSEIIPHADLVVLPGLGHAHTLIRSDLVIPHITMFIDKVERTLK